MFFSFVREHLNKTGISEIPIKPADFPPACIPIASVPAFAGKNKLSSPAGVTSGNRREGLQAHDAGGENPKLNNYSVW